MSTVAFGSRRFFSALQEMLRHERDLLAGLPDTPVLGLTVRKDTWVEHLYEQPWYAAPIPPKWHKCKPVTIGKPFPYDSMWVLRCSCGAYKRTIGGINHNNPWLDRNSRRKKRHQFITDL